MKYALFIGIVVSYMTVQAGSSPEVQCYQAAIKQKISANSALILCAQAKTASGPILCYQEAKVLFHDEGPVLYLCGRP